jgi:hypothetical protein
VSDNVLYHSRTELASRNVCALALPFSALVNAGRQDRNKAPQKPYLDRISESGSFRIRLGTGLTRSAVPVIYLQQSVSEGADSSRRNLLHSTEEEWSFEIILDSNIPEFVTQLTNAGVSPVGSPLMRPQSSC